MAGELFIIGPRKAGVVLGALIALKIALLFVFAVHGRFVMDEFVQLGWAQYFGHGLFDTIWPAKAVGYAIFFKLAHLTGWDAVAARALTPGNSNRAATSRICSPAFTTEAERSSIQGIFFPLTLDMDGLALLGVSPRRGRNGDE